MIEFKNVSKIYPNGTKALDGINLKIEDGEFVFICGHSGAGKSTLTKLLLREEKPTYGTLLSDGRNVGKLSHFRVPYYRRRIGFVFQDSRLFEDKTVYENVAFSMHVIGASRRLIKKRIPMLLKMVGLSDKAKCYPNELSGGEAQRVALARALANDPETIIADEPTGNIDPQMSYEIMKLLINLNKPIKNSKNKKPRKRTVIVVTHEKTLVDLFRQRVISLKEGRIVDDKVGGMFNA